MGTWSSIIYVTQHMQLVDSQPLYHVTDGNDKVVGPANRNNRIYDGTDISCLVGIVSTLMQQLLYNIREFWRKGFPDL